MHYSAAALVFQIHGSMLRSACHRAGRHFEGLAQAARFLRQRGYISTPMLKKLIRIDDTFNVLRHITKESGNNYLSAFQKEIDSEPASRHIEDENQACVKTKVLEDLPVPVEVLMKMDPDFSEIETKQIIDTDELVPTSGTTGDRPTEANPEIYPSGHTYGEDRAELAQKAYRCRMKRIQLRSEDAGPVSGGDCHPHKSEDPFDEDWKEMALKAYRCRMKRLHVRDPGYATLVKQTHFEKCPEVDSERSV